MTDKIAQITEKMIAYDKGDIPRIEHFMKVYGYAAAIGKLEKLDPATQEILTNAGQACTFLPYEESLAVV